MNTVKSVYYGWGTLIVAGGGAYYFAKKSINADRAAKAEIERQKRIHNKQLEEQAMQYQLHPQSSQNPTAKSVASTPFPTQTQAPTSADAIGGGGKTAQAIKKAREMQRAREDKDWHKQVDEAGEPSLEASQDPAPTRHAPVDDAQKVGEKSKYEASEPYRSKKGDRFS